MDYFDGNKAFIVRNLKNVLEARGIRAVFLLYLRVLLRSSQATLYRTLVCTFLVTLNSLLLLS